MFVDVADGKLFALRHGDRSKQTIIGIGGFVGSSELWAEPFAQLSDRWSTIAYDHRGTGASIASTSSITFDNLIGDLFAVMDAFGVERGVIAAESSGALTALTAALARPGRVSHLVIVDGLYDREASSGADLSDWQQYLLTSYEAWVKQFVADCIPEPDSEHVRKWGNKILGRVAPEDAVALSNAAPVVGIRPRLGEIDQPTLVIHGRLDALVPVEHAEQLAASIPISELRIFEDAGHVPSLTRPTQVADAVAAFLTAY
jgi:pimeloyl-ACP methyl ester carboxylesterase